MSKFDLEAYAKEHITYEIRMLVGTATEWPVYYNFGNGLVSNALHNSFAIHARNLDDFLSSKQGVRAHEDYGVTIDWPEPIWRTQINRKVAHLLPGRKPGNDTADAFNMNQIVKDLGDGLLRFYDNLPSERKNWFAVIPKIFRPEDHL